MDVLIKFHNFKIGEDRAEFASTLMLFPARLAFGGVVFTDKTHDVSLCERVVGLALVAILLPVVLVLTIAGLATVFFSKTHNEKAAYYHAHKITPVKPQN